MRKIAVSVVFLVLFSGVYAETSVSGELPVTSVSLFSSGVGYFEHTGSVRDSVALPLVFDLSAVNDVLKSLVIHDPGTTAPSVTYASEDTLYKTLRSLSIDLSGNPGVADLLGSMRGAEIRLQGARETTGRIVGVEKKAGPENGAGREFLSVSTGEGILVFDIAEISGFSFTDKRVSDDLKRGLDLIASSRNDSTRSLLVTLPGKGPRQVSLGYVAPAPVWKASYRLDLSGGDPVIQGWAIVDNTGEMDWTNIRLSLVTGKPVSFIQNLYPPYYFARPVVPLSIAGAAEAEVYDSGYDGMYQDETAAAMEAAPAPAMAARKAESSIRASNGGAAASWKEDAVETATGAASGEFFEFTMPKPVTIARQQSAMLPLVEAALKGEKVSVYSAGSAHPMLCVRLTNTSGMKLPAGPVTVFDGGAYSGDALVEFFPENEKRLLAFGEDIAVSGSEASSSSGSALSMTASKGVLTVTRKYLYAKTYQFRNADSKARTLVVEHPVMANATLVSPAAYDERTDSVYRFSVNLPADGEARLEVREEKPDRKAVSLLNLDAPSLAYYGTSSDVPANVKAAMAKAVALRKKMDDASTLVSSLNERKAGLVSDQDRIRRNLEAAGNDTQQGKEYLKKMAQADTDIEKLSAEIVTARKSQDDAAAAYRNYLSELEL